MALPSGLAMIDSTHSEKEKDDETCVLEAAGRALMTGLRVVMARADTANLIVDIT